MDLEQPPHWAMRGRDHADRDLARRLQPGSNFWERRRKPRHRHLSDLPGAANLAVSAALTRRVIAGPPGFALVAHSCLSDLHADLVRGDIFYWGELMAAALIASVPVAIAYNLFLDRFISGITGGAVK